MAYNHLISNLIYNGITNQSQEDQGINEPQVIIGRMNQQSHLILLVEYAKKDSDESNMII